MNYGCADASLERFRSQCTHFVYHQAVLKTFPGTAAVLRAHFDREAQHPQLRRAQVTATLKKSAEEKRAIAAALPVANAFYLLYLEDETDPAASEKAHALRCNKTDYVALPAAMALAETRRVAQQALALKAKLASDAGIAKPELDELTAANAAFGQLLAAPKLAIEAGKTNRTALGTALKATDKFVEAKLRPAIKTLSPAFAGLRAALLQAMRIDDAPGARQPAAPGAAPAPGSTPA